jgi:hypothetical protein
MHQDLIALAQNAELLVHQVADLDYLERHDMTGVNLQRTTGLHTDVTRSVT